MVQPFIHEHMFSSFLQESYTREKQFAHKNARFLNTGVKIRHYGLSGRHVCRRSCPPGSLRGSSLKLRYSTIGEINRAKTQGIIMARRVSGGFTETLMKRKYSIPHSRFGLAWRQTRNFKKRQRVKESQSVHSLALRACKGAEHGAVQLSPSGACILV
jgi:hypothetical protein